MNHLTLLPAAALMSLVAFAAGVMLRERVSFGSWQFPAALSAVFFLFSLVTVANEGLFGFWIEHTDSLWGNQVWFDLLLAFGMVWVLLLPRARAQGMKPAPWLIFFLCTGCIGLTAMFARVIYLENVSLAKAG